MPGRRTSLRVMRRLLVALANGIVLAAALPGCTGPFSAMDCGGRQERELATIKQTIAHIVPAADSYDLNGTTGCDSGDRASLTWAPHEGPDVTLEAARRAGWQDMAASDIGEAGSGVSTLIDSRRLDLIFFQVDKTFEAAFER